MSLPTADTPTAPAGGRDPDPHRTMLAMPAPDARARTLTIRLHADPPWDGATAARLGAAAAHHLGATLTMSVTAADGGATWIFADADPDTPPDRGTREVIDALQTPLPQVAAGRATVTSVSTRTAAEVTSRLADAASPDLIGRAEFGG